MNFRRGRTLLIIAAVAALAAVGVGLPLAAHTTEPLRFANVTVQENRQSGEPSTAVDTSTSPATIYVTAPAVSRNGTAQLWSSTDDGRTFVPLAATTGMGDTDVVVDETGTLYVADLGGPQGSVQVSISHDRGRSFDQVTTLAPNDDSRTGFIPNVGDPDASSFYDRQWIATDNDGHVVVTAHYLSANATDPDKITEGDAELAWSSADGGRTWSGPATVTRDIGLPGPLTTAPDGRFLMTYLKLDGSVGSATSTDAGKTWSLGTVSDMVSHNFPVIAADRAGNIYAAWDANVNPPLDYQDQAMTTGIYLASSVDGGHTWSQPTIVSDATRTALMPWMVARDAGAVDVAWYASSDAVPPDLGTPFTSWSIEVAQSHDATSSSPSFNTTVAAANVHTGSICTQGIGCLGPASFGVLNAPTPFDRRMLDFFEIDLLPSGRMVMTYPQDRGAFSGNTEDVVRANTDLMVGVQVGGPGVGTLDNPLAARNASGYWLAASDGGVFTFGGARFQGSSAGTKRSSRIAGIASTPDGGGYWLATADGNISSFGNARNLGQLRGTRLHSPIVGIAATPDGNGYWLTAADGGAFTFGSARFFGSTGNLRLHSPIVGMAATPDGNGYWLTAADGGVFTFGSARFFGSTGNLRLHSPIVGMATTPDGNGYWLTAADGGVFTFGSARFHGSAGGTRLRSRIVAIASTPSGGGYWLAAADGSVLSFGDAPAFGSMAPIALAHPVVGFAAR